MFDKIVVLALVALAAAYLVRRFLRRSGPGCGCSGSESSCGGGCSCAGSSGGSSSGCCGGKELTQPGGCGCRKD